MRAETARANKPAVRAAALARRDALPPVARARAARWILQRILALDAFARARVVMAYCSFGSELDTSAFLAAIFAQGKTLALPRVDRRRGLVEVFLVRDPDHELVADAWGIREPDPERCSRVPLPALDFVLVPGVAFDPRGGRLGYGKGYYDRLFHACRAAGARPSVVAAAFEAQLVDEVPMEPHDVAVPCIITEARSIEVSGGGPGVP